MADELFEQIKNKLKDEADPRDTSEEFNNISSDNTQDAFSEQQEKSSVKSDKKKKVKKVSDIDFILDIPLKISVELGRTKLLINDLLKLNQGSVIELNKLPGEPLEVFVNNKLVAKGEAVVVNEKLGVRLIDIITPNGRVKKLGE
jgi:flagellar motor switch protein FliN/FliY